MDKEKFAAAFERAFGRRTDPETDNSKNNSVVAIEPQQQASINPQQEKGKRKNKNKNKDTLDENDILNLKIECRKLTHKAIQRLGQIISSNKGSARDVLRAIDLALSYGYGKPEVLISQQLEANINSINIFDASIRTELIKAIDSGDDSDVIDCG